MIKSILIILSLSVILFSCDNIIDKTKKTVNKSGKLVGKTATEFVDGVSDGIDETLDCEVIISEELINEGVKTGAYSIATDSNGNKNILKIYLIFKKELNRALLVTALNKDSLEMGRSLPLIQASAGDARYFTIPFDKETQIDSKSIIRLE